MFLLKSTSNNICTALYCRNSTNDSTCYVKPGGAMEGTTCASGKVNK
jgi:hypothetical protein